VDAVTALPSPALPLLAPLFPPPLDPILIGKLRLRLRKHRGSREYDGHDENEPGLP
jgi:hypothetical protein